MSINLVVVSGNLVHDSEIKQSKNGKSYIYNKLAVWMSPTFTVFLDFQWFFKDYEAAEFHTKDFKKGNAIFVEGSLSVMPKILSDGTKANLTVINAKFACVSKLSKKNLAAQQDGDAEGFAYEEADGDEPWFKEDGEDKASPPDDDEIEF